MRSQQQPPPGATINIFQTWFMALAPSEANYVRIANDPNASLGRAYLWLFVALVVGGILSTLIGAVVNLVLGPSSNPALQSLGAGSVTGGALINELCIGVPIQAVLGLLGLTLGAVLSHGLALALGGHGRFTQLMYAISAYAVPLILVDSLVGSIPIIGLLLVIVFLLYALLLNVVATKAVYQFGWGQAAMSGIGVPILLLVLIACVTILALALLGPAIGKVFSNIVTTI